MQTELFICISAYYLAIDGRGFLCVFLQSGCHKTKQEVNPVQMMVVVLRVRKGELDSRDQRMVYKREKE